jgi:nucleoside-diphosphate-sugar epimerase
MKIVVIGGTGLIGPKTVAILRRRGHEVVAASRKWGVDSITGEGHICQRRYAAEKSQTIYNKRK